MIYKTILLSLAVSACATAKNAAPPILPPDQASLSTAHLQNPQAIIEPEKIPILNLPHPEGYSTRELEAIFLTARAPQRPDLAECDHDLLKLEKFTTAKDEIRQGARELVVEDPATHHWCFYERLLSLEEKLKTSGDILEKQELTMAAFQYALPMARAFQSEFRDSRYLRWTIQRYRALSPSIFFRKVELTPDATQELAVLENPFSNWKAEIPENSILAKYGLKTVPPTAQLAEQKPEANRAPAAAPSPVPTPDPTPTPTPTPAAPAEREPAQQSKPASVENKTSESKAQALEPEPEAAIEPTL